jgi:DNA-binding CsgD family transcriptional regulator
MALHKLSPLSPREQEIVQLLIAWHFKLSVRLQLGISGTTVKTHRNNADCSRLITIAARSPDS